MRVQRVDGETRAKGVLPTAMSYHSFSSHACQSVVGASGGADLDEYEDGEGRLEAAHEDAPPRALAHQKRDGGEREKVWIGGRMRRREQERQAGGGALVN